MSLFHTFVKEYYTRSNVIGLVSLVILLSCAAYAIRPKNLNYSSDVTSLAFQAAHFSKQVYIDTQKDICKKPNLKQGDYRVYPDGENVFIAFRGTDFSCDRERNVNFDSVTFLSIGLFALLAVLGVVFNIWWTPYGWISYFLTPGLYICVMVFFGMHVSRDLKYSKSLDQLEMDEISQILETRKESLPSDGRLIITGHSKGGSEAELYFKYIVENHKALVDHVDLITFAALPTIEGSDLAFENIGNSKAINFNIDLDIANLKYILQGNKVHPVKNATFQTWWFVVFFFLLLILTQFYAFKKCVNRTLYGTNKVFRTKRQAFLSMSCVLFGFTTLFIYFSFKCHFLSTYIETLKNVSGNVEYFTVPVYSLDSSTVIAMGLSFLFFILSQVFLYRGE